MLGYFGSAGFLDAVGTMLSERVRCELCDKPCDRIHTESSASTNEMAIHYWCHDACETRRVSEKRLRSNASTELDRLAAPVFFFEGVMRKHRAKWHPATQLFERKRKGAARRVDP